jgi:soluble lytic murein transglycosylase
LNSIKVKVDRFDFAVKRTAPFSANLLEIDGLENPPCRAANLNMELTLQSCAENADIVTMKIAGKTKAISVVLGILILMPLFQNMSLVDFKKLDIANVDEAARRDQARELLGVSYQRSFARKLEGRDYLNYLIYRKFEQTLGAKWQSRIPKIVQTLVSDSQEQGYDPIFILAVIQTESRFNADTVGSVGEIGLMQIRPETAKWIAQQNDEPWAGRQSLFDPVTNIHFGILYFSYLRAQFPHEAYHYLPAYNMGPTNMRRVQRSLASIDESGHVQKREYAMRVMRNYALIYEQMFAQQMEVQATASAEVESTTL